MSDTSFVDFASELPNKLWLTFVRSFTEWVEIFSSLQILVFRRRQPSDELQTESEIYVCVVPEFSHYQSSKLPNDKNFHLKSDFEKCLSFKWPQKCERSLLLKAQNEIFERWQLLCWLALMLFIHKSMTVNRYTLNSLGSRSWTAGCTGTSCPTSSIRPGLHGWKFGGNEYGVKHGMRCGILQKL